MPLVLSRNDGPYETTILHLTRPHGLRLPFQWIVRDRRDKRSDSGRSRTEEYAKHDARTALRKLQADAGEDQAA